MARKKIEKPSSIHFSTVLKTQYVGEMDSCCFSTLALSAGRNQNALWIFFLQTLEIFSRKIVGCYGRDPILPLNYIFNEIFPHVCIYGFINKNTCFVFLGEFYDPNEDDENDDEDWLPPPSIRSCDPEIIRALQDFIVQENIRL